MPIYHLQPDGRIDFRKCLAVARRQRALNHKVNQRCPDLAAHWATLDRRRRVASYMSPLQCAVGDEKAAFAIGNPWHVITHPPEYADSFEVRS
jgi:hypothetical protein